MPIKNKKFLLIAGYWFLGAIILTILCGLVYVSVQQAIRQGANDPQIQIAEDAARLLEAGGVPQIVLGQNISVPIEQSLAPYVVVFDGSGKPVAGSGKLNGQLPSLPVGIFDFVRAHGEDRVTWQPETGVRSAIVIVGYGGKNPGFVMAGRSLWEVEKRVDWLTAQIAGAWLSALFVLFASITLFVWKKSE
jgi:hypothetical protein